MIATVLDWFRSGNRPAKQTARSASPRLETLEGRVVPTTTGWTRGVAPAQMNFGTSVQTELDQVTASKTLNHVAVRDNVTRSLTFVAPTTGAYRIGTALDPVSRRSLDTVLGVYDADGVRLATNNNVGRSKFAAVTVNLEAGEEYQIGVGRYCGPRSRGDRLTRFTQVKINGPDDDASEAQGGDSLENPVALGNVTGGRVLGGLVMADKADFFSFHLPAGGTANDAVKIGFQAFQGNLDLSLFDSAGNLVAESNGTGDIERISLDGLVAGDYTVEVFGVDGLTNPQYDLTITQGEAPAPQNDLGQALVQWASDRLGQQVSSGECAELTHAALLANGALSCPDLGPAEADSDYVWGTLVVEFHGGDSVDLLDQVQAGDIIQYRDARLEDDNSFLVAHHHTSMVEVNNGGGELTVLQQNFNGNRFVTRESINLAGMTEGTIWIYRAIPR